jgi:hypothetical protein
MSSQALRKTWHQLGENFGGNIIFHDDPEVSNKWVVLQPATGTGKSQGAIVYCSLLSKLNELAHPGVLIVTRLKIDADLMAAQINQLSGRDDYALAHHSDSQTKLTDLKDFPVVVITHRAFEMALDFLGHDGTIQQTWPLFHEWNVGHRKLVIVDECLDCVEQNSAGLDGLNRTLGLIPFKVKQQFPYEIEAIEAIIEVLTSMDQIAKDQPMRELMLLQEMITEGATPDFTALRAALKKEVRWDFVSLQRTDPKENDRLGRIHDERLRSLHAIFRSWIYYARVEGKHTLNTARLLVPELTKGPVVLDATASSNPLYEVFDRAVVCAAPEGARNYRNVTLHVSRGHKTGKRYMSSKAKRVTADLMAELNDRIEPDRKVFIICHKDVEPILATHTPAFEMSIGHWGAVAGSNEWRECDAVVIFGLPYRRDTWAPNVFMACQGPQTTEWLNGTGERPFNGYKDIRQALNHGQMVTDIVQAINRVRCRKVIDIHGNCPPTEVYLLLPNGDIADILLDGIRREMPGIKVGKWNYSKQRQKKRGRPKRSNHELGLIKFLENMADGRVSPAHIRNVLGMSPTTMARLVSKVDDPETDLAKAMRQTGVKYEVIRTGKTQRAFFVKDSDKRLT